MFALNFESRAINEETRPHTALLTHTHTHYYIASHYAGLDQSLLERILLKVGDLNAARYVILARKDDDDEWRARAITVSVEAFRHFVFTHVRVVRLLFTCDNDGDASFFGG